MVQALENEKGPEAGDGSGQETANTAPVSENESRIARWSKAINHGFSRLIHGLSTTLAVIFVAIYCAIVFIPGAFSIPTLDRDEARYAQTSKQMIETGNYIDPYFQDEPRYKKPVGIYWLQAFSAQMIDGAQSDIWAYRIPSLLGATGVAVLTVVLGSLFASPGVGLLAGLFVASSILLGVEARHAKTDAVLVFTILVSQIALARVYLYREPSKPGMINALIFWVFLAFSVLIKGPIGLLVCGATVIFVSAYERSLAWLRPLRPLIGFGIFLLLSLPWFIFMQFETGGAFFQEAVGRDFLGKIVEGQESHGAPPGTHLAVTLLTFWPASMFLILAVPYIWSQRREPVLIFCLSWIIPVWIVFEISVTKLPHYLMPVFPALAVLTAKALIDDKVSTKSRLAFFIWTLFLILPIGFVAVSAAGPIILENRVFVLPGLFCLVGALIAFYAWRSLNHGRELMAVALYIAAMPAFYWGIYQFAAPNLDRIWITPRMVASAKEHAYCSGVELASIGYSEPSLPFEAGTKTRLLPPDAVTSYFKEGACQLLFIEEIRHLETVKAALGDDADRLIKLDQVDGLRLNGGKDQSIGVYRLGDPVAPSPE